MVTSAGGVALAARAEGTGQDLSVICNVTLILPLITQQITAVAHETRALGRLRRFYA
jgi:hypothetical protein